MTDAPRPMSTGDATPSAVLKGHDFSRVAKFINISTGIDETHFKSFQLLAHMRRIRFLCPRTDSLCARICSGLNQNGFTM